MLIVIGCWLTEEFFLSPTQLHYLLLMSHKGSWLTINLTDNDKSGFLARLGETLCSLRYALCVLWIP